MCEYCEEIFDSTGDYNPATGRFDRIKTTKPLQCYAGDIHNDALKTIWISIYPNVNKYILWCRPYDSNPIRREENKIKAEINYCPMCGRELRKSEENFDGGIIWKIGEMLISALKSIKYLVTRGRIG